MTLPEPADFSPQAVAERARLHLYEHAYAAPQDAAHSDAAIAGFVPGANELAAARPAAVLIPIIARREGATLLLTRRAASLREHSGQIAFPGGRIDAADEGPLGAAMREAHEEIGLSASAIQPLGFLGPYFSSTGYKVTPVVALVEPDMPLRLNASEVDATFETPLSFLMNPANHHQHEREWKGQPRQYFAMPYGEHYIWGVTAGIIRMLWLRLYAPHRP
jgi:8-oxo-dGTP pyrophosphatase MutT (NUDIX family)